MSRHLAEDEDVVGAPAPDACDDEDSFLWTLPWDYKKNYFEPIWEINPKRQPDMLEGALAALPRCHCEMAKQDCLAMLRPPNNC